MAKRNKKIVSALSTIVVLFAIVLVIGIVSKFTGGFREEFSPFSVSVNGTAVSDGAKGYTISSNKSLTIKVDYLYELANDTDKIYNYKITPNTDQANNFVFTLDNEAKAYSNEKDLTNGFTFEESNNSFVVKYKGDINTVLKSNYPNKTVSDCSDKISENMFVLTVTSIDGKYSTKIYFGFPLQVTSITLDTEEVGVN